MGQSPTLAGGSARGFADGVGAAAQFNAPHQIAIGPNGFIYVADFDNNRIRKVSPLTGEVTTLAGTGEAGHVNGPAASAKFRRPQGLTVGPDGTVYVAENSNHRIRSISPAGLVSTVAGSGINGFADGATTVAQFSYPAGLAVASDGTLYVADGGGNRIRAISNGMVTTIAGDGTAGLVEGSSTTARFRGPSSIAVNANGELFIADRENHSVRKISPLGVTAPSAPTVTEDDVNVALDDNIHVYDQNVNSTQTVTFSIIGGTVSLGTTGITFGGGGNGSSNFTAQGKLSAVNTALDAATFTPTPDFGAEANIFFFSNNGTLNSNNAGISFNVTAVNDAPQLTIPAALSTNEDTPLSFTAEAFSLADPDAGRFLQVKATSTLGTITIRNGQLPQRVRGVLIKAGAYGTNTITVQGGTGPLVRWMKLLTFIPHPDAQGQGSILFEVTDQGNSGTGGELTDSKTLPITITPVNDIPAYTKGAGRRSGGRLWATDACWLGHGHERRPRE